MRSWPLVRPPRPLIGAHRGASGPWPENSHAAFRAALAASADFVEIDLRLTADGVAAACHDADFARLCGDARAVADLTLAEARALHPALSTIGEALDIVRPAALALLDVKLTDAESLRRVADLLGDRAADRGVALGLRSPAAVQALCGRLTRWPRIGLFADPEDHAHLRADGASWARLWQSEADADGIAAVRRLGLNVLVMAGSPTPGGAGLITPAALAGVLAAGADGLLLNDPALAAGIRAARSRMTRQA
jgi:glycerophosphoryl diester phosphodiesterase